FAPLADALRLEGEYEEALTLLENGLVLHPDFQAAMVILGFTLLDDGQKEHGRKILQTVLKMDADNLKALAWLIEDACARSAWAEAVPLLEHMVSIEPDVSHWSQTLTTIQKKETPSPVGMNKAESFATMTLVDIYIAQGYYSKAREALLRMQRQEPGRTDIGSKLAELAASRGGESEAPAADAGRSFNEMQHGRREDLTVKRAAEKKKFAEWLGRIETDESASQ
ncbi:MAG: tetratricopeptide (TPR) repeat protein, partial [Candidatus Krumholzibacteriia bacterium]